ncbi:hypothetical protein REPUB_Repub15cG0123600 [Reevesia pubescens]
MPSTSFNILLRRILQRRIKKTEKKVKKWKASTAQMRQEITQLTNSVENCYQGIVLIREEIHQHNLAAESANAELLQLISALLGDI